MKRAAASGEMRPDSLVSMPDGRLALLKNCWLFCKIFRPTALDAAAASYRAALERRPDWKEAEANLALVEGLAAMAETIIKMQQSLHMH